MAVPVGQGQVWLAELAEGYERPCVVVSRNALNKGRLCLVVPCSSSAVETKTQFPNNVFLKEGAGGLPLDSACLTHLIQPIETRLLRHLYGALAEEDLTRVLHALAWSVDLFERV